jgi:hypothetical protein
MSGFLKGLLARELPTTSAGPGVAPRLPSLFETPEPAEQPGPAAAVTPGWPASPQGRTGADDTRGREGTAPHTSEPAQVPPGRPRPATPAGHTVRAPDTRNRGTRDPERDIRDARPPTAPAPHPDDGGPQPPGVPVPRGPEPVPDLPVPPAGAVGPAGPGASLGSPVPAPRRARPAPPAGPELRPRPAGPDPAAAAGKPAAPEPVIHVSIGRIEVRAVPAESRTAARPEQPQPMSLDEYLERRNQGGRQ